MLEFFGTSLQFLFSFISVSLAENHPRNWMISFQVNVVMNVSSANFKRKITRSLSKKSQFPKLQRAKLNFEFSRKNLYYWCENFQKEAEWKINFACSRRYLMRFLMVIVVIVQHCLKSDTVNPYQNVTKCNKIPPCILVSTPQFHTI